MADYGGKLGIRVTIENHWGLAADPMNVRTIIDEVNHPYCEASPDFCNWEHDYMLVHGLKALAPYAHTNVHAKYWDRWGDKNDVQRSDENHAGGGFKGTFALEYEAGPLNGVEGAKYLYREVLAALSARCPSSDPAVTARRLGVCSCYKAVQPSLSCRPRVVLAPFCGGEEAARSLPGDSWEGGEMRSVNQERVQILVAARHRAADDRAAGVGAAHDRHGDRNGQGPAGRRHPRRDGHAHQRHARHDVCSGRHQRQRRLHCSSTSPPTRTPSKSRMRSFKTLKRSGVSVSPGTRASVGDLTLEVGGTTDTVVGQGRSAGHPGARAASAPSRSRRARSRTCRSRTAASPRSRRSRPGVNARPATRLASAAAATPTS